ncbi:hypothetical protein J6TS2_36920 [Heyndrickxia sporothermodurans]|nr:hypothetical protein J6TS2_36920 [Heyndrickxia sporothermodurans]
MSKKAVHSLLCLLLLSTLLYFAWVYVSLKNVVTTMDVQADSHEVSVMYKTEDQLLKSNG